MRLAKGTVSAYTNSTKGGAIGAVRKAATISFLKSECMLYVFLLDISALRLGDLRRRRAEPGGGAFVVRLGAKGFFLLESLITH
jgi:hypothetical protein